MEVKPGRLGGAVALQAMHAPAAASEYVLAGHAVHAVVLPTNTPPAVEKEPAEQLPVHAADGLPPRPYVPALHGEQTPVVANALQLPGAHTVQPDAGTGPHPALRAQLVVRTLGAPK